KRRLQRVQGGGEIRFGRLGAGAGAERWIATIEPLHGDKLVVYPIRDTSPTANPADRVVLANDFVQGHAIAIADLAGQGRPQIVAGWRNKNAAGDTGVRLYWLDDDGNWQSQWVDQSGMAAEDLRVGDLNGDGRPDIVAAGRATKNLRVYWNEGRQK
ncbi:MAG TPA: VCBS repeat-containing protein, partial [Planctomycetes bacterium]|nr:VCBS repeat-containing protein [Planctomycetota bacterium]